MPKGYYQRTPQKRSEAMKEMEKKAASIDLLQMVRYEKQGYLESFSKSIGHKRMVQSRLKNGGDVKMSLVLLLSQEMKINFLNHYLRLLPEELRNTFETSELEKELNDIKNQLEESNKQTAYWKERAERAEGWIAGKMDK